MKTHLRIVLVAAILLQIPAFIYAQAPNLGTAGNFSLFTSAGAFNNLGPTVITSGDIGNNVGVFAGFPPGTLVSGQIHVADAVSAQAALDLATAYGSLSSVTCGAVLGTTLGNNQVLTPNVYCAGAASTLNGVLTLDGQGNPNALFIIKIDGALSTGTFSSVNLINSASVSNVYWQINGEFILEANSDFKGTILANGAISLLGSSSLYGRGLSIAGAISLNSNMVSLTLPAAPLPSITCPQNIAISATTGLCGAVVNYTVTYSNGTLTQTSGLPSGSTFPVGTTTNGFQVVDLLGNTANCSFTVVVADNEAPGIVCPAAMNVNADQGSCNATGVTLVAPTTSDNCGGTTLTNNAPATFPTGVTMVTWKATDNSGNTATCMQMVTVIDNQAPIISCPPLLTANTSPILCSVSGLNLGIPVVSDNCTPTNALIITNNAPSNYPAGITNITWTVADAGGNSATCIQVVQVIDNIPPVIICPSAINVNADQGSCNATGVTLVAPTTSDNCGGTMLTNNAPATFPTGVTMVTWVATDNSGNTATCMQMVTVIDNQAPVISCPPLLMANTSPTLCSASGLNLGIPVVSDNCTPTNVLIITNNAPSNYPAGITNITWTVTDAAGNSATCIQGVQVIDNIPPVITCPAAINVNADQGSCNATGVSLIAPTTSDNCGGTTLTNNAPSGFPKGVTIVTWEAIDNSGNTATCMQMVTVIDNQAPVIICPPLLMANTSPTLCSASGLNLGIPVVSDNCTPTNALIITSNAPAVFPAGITNITWKVTDADGNSATCIQVVEVIDNIPPVITCPANITSFTSPLDCLATSIDLGTATGSDNCWITGIFNDAPLQFPTGISMVTWTVTDMVYNSATCIQSVLVIDNQPPTISCPADLNINADAGECFASGVILGTPTVMDNCPNTTLSNNALIQYPVGSTIVVWTVTDVDGNTATCLQQVTVVDNQPPAITCQSNLTINNTPGECGAAGPALAMPITSDNCTGLVISSNAPSFIPMGTTVVTWTATDNSGNTATCMQSITVIDNQPPFINCVGNIIQSANPDVCTSIVYNIVPVTGDNCPGFFNSYNLSGVTSGSGTGNANGMIFNKGLTVVTYLVTDAVGLSATCSFTVTINDNQPPLIAAPANIVVNTNPGVCFASGIVLGNPVASDNCFLVSYTNNGLPSYPKGLNTVTWTATDGSGNSSTALQTITVIDNELPTISCPLNISTSVDPGTCNATNVLLGNVLLTDNCPSALASNNAPLVYPLGTTIVKWTVTDASGNTATCQQSVIIYDNVPPVIICPADITVNNTFNQCNAVNVNLGSPVSIENCSGSSLNNNAPSVFPVGVSIVTWTAVDVSGNSSTCTQKVTVVDNQPPEITCPGSISVYGTTNVVIPLPVVSDNCAVAFISNSNNDTQDASGTYSVGTTTVTWMVTDIHGNTATCTQLIFVNCPVVANNDTIIMAFNTPGPVNLSGNDVFCGSAVSCDNISVLIPAAHINASISTIPGDLILTPQTGYLGHDSLKYQICCLLPDGSSECSEAWAFISVTNPPAAHISGNSTICPYGYAIVTFTMIGQPPFTIQYTDGVGIFTQAGIMSNTWTIGVTANATTTYSLISVTDASTLYGVVTGSAVITVNSIPYFIVTGGGFYCPGMAGVVIGLSGSTPNILYQMVLNGIPYGLPQLGTGQPLNFGLVNLPGTYFISAQNLITNCFTNMYGSAEVTLWTVPEIYTVTGGGECCFGCTFIHVGLNGSQTGVTYYLWRNGILQGSLPGTGGSLDFGYMTQSGYYTVSATSENGCISQMTGQAVVLIHPVPEATLQPQNLTVCQGDSTWLWFDMTVGTGPWTFTLSTGNGLITFITDLCTPAHIAVAPSQTTTYTLLYVSDAYCSNYASGSVTITVITCVPNPLHSLSGRVIYENTSGTGMNNTGVVLKSGNIVMDSVITDINGHYGFENLSPGNYSLTLSTGKAWGGANATDALMITKDFTQIITLQGLYKSAADVNMNGYDNAVDALYILKRFVHQINSFPSGDWVFENPAVNINNANVNMDILSLCYGDVNGSFIPSGAKLASTVSLSMSGQQEVRPYEEFDVPVSIVNPLKPSAISLVLNYPVDLLEVKSVSIDDPGNGTLIYNIDNGELRIAWYNSKALDMASGATLLHLGFRMKKPVNISGSEFVFSLGSGSEIANYDGAVIRNVNLMIPKLIPARASLDLDIYPNPAIGNTEIVFVIPEPGTVNLIIYDILGNKVATLMNEWKDAGKNSVMFNAMNLPQGIYTCRLILTGTTRSGTMTKRLEIIK